MTTNDTDRELREQPPATADDLASAIYHENGLFLSELWDRLGPLVLFGLDGNRGRTVTYELLREIHEGLPARRLSAAVDAAIDAVDPSGESRDHLRAIVWQILCESDSREEVQP